MANIPSIITKAIKIINAKLAAADITSLESLPAAPASGVESGEIVDSIPVLGIYKHEFPMGTSAQQVGRVMLKTRKK